MSEGLEATVAAAFAGETGTTPVVNMSGADASIATSTNAVTAVITEDKTNSKFYTEEDLAKVRSQEKSKLYPEIESLKEELNSLKKEREEEAARKAAEASAQAEAEALKAKEIAESELEVRDLLKVKEQEWQEQLERERQERERAFALLEQERNFTDLQNYRNQRVEQEREAIIPELLDLLAGNTREEVEASIEGLKERSARILESAQQAMQTARRDMTGTRATLPPAGPLDTNSAQRSFTAQEIASMSVQEYAQYRDKLMSPQARGVSQGMFGNP
jgi:DNA repair exonuclease SbcCD ATPase subunit